MYQMIAGLNLPLTAVEALKKNLKSMFPDSKIAQDMKCGRSKATAIIKEMTASAKEALASRMQSGPFTVSTDGSNDADSKQFPPVRSFDPESGAVNSELFTIAICDGYATGINIFNLIDYAFKERNIPWKNFIALGSDNAKVLTGKDNRVIAHVRKMQPHVIMAGCCLHLVHIGARKGAEHLPPVDTVLNDIFYYFEKSLKRKTGFAALQDMWDIEQKRMLKHVCTRWLNIGRCLTRLLHNWDALKVFFEEEHEKLQKTSNKTGEYTLSEVEGIFNFVKSPANRLTTLFLNYTVKVFDEALLPLQAEDPKIHVL